MIKVTIKLINKLDYRMNLQNKLLLIREQTCSSCQIHLLLRIERARKDNSTFNLILWVQHFF